eukprot:3614925-Prymnesium_polylepis.1
MRESLSLRRDLTGVRGNGETGMVGAWSGWLIRGAGRVLAWFRAAGPGVVAVGGNVQHPPKHLFNVFSCIRATDCTVVSRSLVS